MAKSLDALYYEIGKEILDKRAKREQYRINSMRNRGVKFKLGPKPRYTRLQVISAARELLAKHYKKLHELICKRKARLSALLASDEASFIALVADLVAGVSGMIPPTSFARLLTKIGLARLCAENPFEDDGSG